MLFEGRRELRLHNIYASLGAIAILIEYIYELNRIIEKLRKYR